ncbi:MAG: STM3941 family protein [Propionicimonas sp.]|uniref:STM3941 family protein n=1 Tax=Propionicimonas sp. TaxID=1955623 RepID=UPI003D12B6D3
MAGSRFTDARTLAHFPELVEFTPDRAPRVRLAFFGMAMVAASTALFLLPAVPLAGINILAVLGWVGLAFFIPATTYAVVRAVQPHVALRLAPEGLTDGSSMSAVGFVPWQRVSGVGTTEISGSRLVGIYLDDPDAFIAGLDPVRRIAARTNLRMFGSPVWISANGLPPADDLAALIDVYRRGWVLHGQAAPRPTNA